MAAARRVDFAPAPPSVERHFGGILVAERMYLVVAGVIVAAIAGDIVANDGTLSLYLVRKLIRLVEYLEFWR